MIWALKNHSIYFSPDVRVTIHSRILQPLLDITLLFLGLPLVAARDNRNVFVAIGICMGLVALFFIVAIACQQLGAGCLISPALAAWAPLMIFVPAAVGHVVGDVGTLKCPSGRFASSRGRWPAERRPRRLNRAPCEVPRGERGFADRGRWKWPNPARYRPRTCRIASAP